MLVFREHVLWNLAFITPDERVGRLHYQLCRTVVLFQFKQLRVVIQALEVQDIVDVSSSETVDALRIVAHHAHLLSLLRQLIHYLLLCVVSVLILIHQHKLELLHIFPAHILVVFKQYPRLHQQVVKVHCVRLSASLRVPYIYIRYLRPLLARVVSRPRALLIRLRQQQMVLRHRYTVGHRRRLIHLIVQPHLLYYRFY